MVNIVFFLFMRNIKKYNYNNKRNKNLEEIDEDKLCKSIFGGEV